MLERKQRRASLAACRQAQAIAGLLALWAGYVRISPRIISAGLLSLFCALVAAGALPDQEPVVLGSNGNSIAAWPSVLIKLDPSGQLGIDQIIGRREEFEQPRGAAATLGLKKEPIWLRLPVQVDRQETKPWILEVDHHDLAHIEVYLVRAGQVVQHGKLGTADQRTPGVLKSRSHAYLLELGAGQSYDLYLRVQTTGAMILPINLHRYEGFLHKAVDDQMLQGVLVGIAFCLIFYSLTQWLSLREALFVHYALMSAGSLLFVLHFFGLGTQYLWGGNLWVERHIGGLSALIATCGSFLFIGEVLRGYMRTTRHLWTMRAGALLSLLIGLAFALDGLSNIAVANIVTLLGLMPVLLGIPKAAGLAWRRDALGGTLLLAWSIYLGATATVIGVIQGWFPMNYWTLHAFQFGATLDMLLFMHVLGLRAKTLKLTALSATRERDMLSSMAHTDPLTGVLNRRGLYAVLNAAVASSTPDNMLSMYIIDLDGFKPVNDQYGHDVGDELLKGVTQRLQGRVRQSDLVVRFGGDEFVVLALSLGAQEQGAELGSKLLEAFAAPFDLGLVQVNVGASIGYAIAPIDATDPHELLRLADQAMYRSKNEGKGLLRRARKTA